MRVAYTKAKLLHSRSHFLLVSFRREKKARQKDMARQRCRGGVLRKVNLADRDSPLFSMPIVLCARDIFRLVSTWTAGSDVPA